LSQSHTKKEEKKENNRRTANITSTNQRINYGFREQAQLLAHGLGLAHTYAKRSKARRRLPLLLLDLPLRRPTGDLGHLTLLRVGTLLLSLPCPVAVT